MTESSSKSIELIRAKVLNAIERRDTAAMMTEAEELMVWHQSEVDEEKVQAAAVLDEIAQYLMTNKEFALARMAIIGSLRIKGTLSKESGLTTFSYEQLDQLEKCEQAAHAEAVTEVQKAERQPWLHVSPLVVVVALIAVASAWAVFVLIVK